MSEETPVQPELSPIEQEAVSQGWKPKEQFDADPANEGKKWRSAELFLELTPLFSKIDDLHKQNKNLEKGIKTLSDHNKKIEVLAFQRALEKLNKERKEAIANGDLEKVEEIRDRIDELKNTPATPEVQTSVEVPQEFTDWQSRNRWYTSDQEMRTFADGYGTSLARGGMRPDAVLAAVEKRIKEVYPDRFRNPNKDKAPSVEGGKGKGSKGESLPQLTEMEERVLNTMLKAGAPISREEYIKQIRG